MPGPDDFRDVHEITISATAGGAGGRLFRQGQIIGGLYKFKSILGRGGMGYVFRVEHLTLHNDYALKMLAPEQLNAEAKRRFEIEGKAIANLDHPNIVKVYDIGLESGDCPYYVMDLLGGESLSEAVQAKRKIPFARCLEIFIQIADGLGYAHNKGIVHRDVKPSNVVLLPVGNGRWRAKIVDFGIAKLLPSAQLHNQSLTATGTVFGSPLYMSPEQCMGASVDHCSDIYSLGCTIFEVLSGRPPFRGENAMATVMMHQNAPVPSIFESMSGEELPEAIDVLLAKMLAKRPEKRYQSMAQVVHALERLQSGRDIGAPSRAVGTSLVDDNKYKLSTRITSEEASLKNSLPYFWPALFGFVVLVLTAISLYVAINFSGQHHHADLPTGESNDPQFSLDQMMPARRVDLEQSWKAYGDFGNIKSEAILEKGKKMRRFKFPSRSIGYITSEEFAPRDCKGAVSVPYGVRINLEVGRNESQAAIYEPEIIGRIDPAEFKGIEIIGRGTTDTAQQFSKLRSPSESLLMLLKIVEKWNLLSLSLDSVSIKPASFKIINSYKNLCAFSIKSPMEAMDILPQQPFLQRLQVLRVNGIGDIDMLCATMGKSRVLQRFCLEDCTFTAEGFDKLAQCPTLVTLEFKDALIDPLLPTLKNFHSLKYLRIVAHPLTAAQIASITNLPNIQHVQLARGDYSKKDIAKCLDSKIVWE